MKLHEVTSPIKTYIARVRLNNGVTVTATERTESLTYARLIFQHQYGVKNVLSVSELVVVMDEATKTLSPQELQVKSLSDKAKSYNQQAKILKARQKLAKAEQGMMKATSGVSASNKR